MKRTFAVLAAACGLATASTFAAVHYDIDAIATELNARNPSYTGIFDITGSGLGKGYDPSTMTIESATANFLLFDLPLIGGNETVSIQLGGEPFGSNGSFSGSLVLGNSVLGDVFLDLDQNGVLSYTINRGSGSFKVVGAELHAKSDLRATTAGLVVTIPDGGKTLMLLGIAMLGLAAIRKNPRV